MGLQAAGAAVAVDEGVNPGHALVGGSGDDELVFEQMWAGVDLIEAFKEGRQRIGRGRLVAADGHLSRAPLAGRDDFALGGKAGKAVCLNQAAVELAMRLLDEGAGEGRGAAFNGGLQRPLGIDVGERDALQTGDIGLVRKVAPQGAADVVRMRALALDAVGVVGVHLPHQFAQAGDSVRMHGGGEAQGLLNDCTGALAQRVQPSLWQQRLELMRLGVLRDRGAFHGSLARLIAG